MHTGNLNRVEHSREIWASGARSDPHPGASSLSRAQEEGTRLDPASDTELFAVVLTTHYAKSVTDF